ncbi:hypothetical protein BpHYR1_045695 [Brachionus plicatilis]|uniref:Uncharacterized protein n=1 Tax=Brachionus plicatilis TaxID=10195 RepID=A0A3M7SPJ7_BRAPC|nr:hypothetical protein BpHYR1_045695 [Brachionus plicatilis]
MAFGRHLRQTVHRFCWVTMVKTWAQSQKSQNFSALKTRAKDLDFYLSGEPLGNQAHLPVITTLIKFLQTSLFANAQIDSEKKLSELTFIIDSKTDKDLVYFRFK